MDIKELNEAAAREVMGWGAGTKFWVDEDGEIAVYCHAWSPTTNEYQAAMLRDKMRAEGWEITTASSKRGDGVMVRKGRIDYTWSAEAGQMPLAMTRAAVMAKRLEKDEQERKENVTNG